MRVTAVVPLYPPNSRVGAWLATHELLRGLVDAGHTVEVFPMLQKGFKPYSLGGVRVYPQGRKADSLAKADVIISHMGDGGATHREALVLGKPSVRLVHGGTLDIRVLAGSALVVCNSEATLDQISKWPGNKIVVHPPTNPDSFKTTPGDKVTLVNLSPPKGGEIFWRLAVANPDIEFLGVTGGYGNQVMGTAKNVTVIPNTKNMKNDVYAKTKVLLMPSFAESWGMVAVEAMYSGIPVIAKPTPGLRESLGDAGIWVDSTSTKPWSLALRDLLIPENWEIASKKSLARSLEFDPTASKEKFVRAIEGLV